MLFFIKRAIFKELKFKIKGIYMISQIPTGMGYFTYLPPELLNEILMDYLTISDINTLHQAGKNLNPVIATALFAKTEKHLEQLEAKLFEITDLRIHSNSMNNRYYTLPKNDLKKLKNGSEERCIALRDCVCRIFWDMNLNEIFRIMDLHVTEDPLLLSQIIKSKSSHVQYIKINKSNDKNLILFLKMLGGNQLRVKVLNLCINPLDDTVVTLFANAIRENKSLTDLHFEYPISYPKYLKEPIESIKENEQIGSAKFKPIGEQGWHVIKDKKLH